MRQLGTAQRSCLRNLARSITGRWGRNSGWLWDTPSGTRRALNGLVDRGLVEMVEGVAGVYEITEAGRALERELSVERFMAPAVGRVNPEVM